LAETKRGSLVKPTLQTPFHIDFEWWKQNDREWRVYLLSLLSPEHQQAFADMEDDQLVDWVDPETAEVQQVDGLQHLLITHYAQQESFLNERTTLVEAIFRIFLKNGNTPMTVQELAEVLNRPPQTILRMLSGRQVYRGLRPILT